MGIFKDENGRSYGDWTHRDRGRTQENANDIAGADEGPKWYRQTFWIVFFLFVLWPVGLYLMWRGGWPLAVKIVITLVLAVMLVVYVMMVQAMMPAQMAS